MLVLYPSKKGPRKTEDEYLAFTHKFCSKCLGIKPVGYFSKDIDKRFSFGWRYKSHCKDCVHHKKNANRMKWRILRGWTPRKKPMPKEQKIINQRKASRKHYYSHLEQEKLRAKKWRQENPDKQRIYWKNRRFRMRGAAGSFTSSEWENLKDEYMHMCPYCCQFEPQIQLTVDHIIPISKGGTNYIDNIQPLCFSCNSSKGNRLVDNVQTYLFRFRKEILPSQLELSL